MYLKTDYIYLRFLHKS